MKILFLLTQSIDSPSGWGRYFPLARQLVRLGHQVTILALHPDFSNLAERLQEIDGVRVIYVSQMHVSKHGNTKRYFSAPVLLFHAIRATWRLSIAAVRLKVDIIHICKPHPMNGIAGWLAHKLRGAQLWLDCDDYEAASGRFNGRFQKSIVAGFEKLLPRFASRITTNTIFMQAKLVSWGIPPEKISYLPNGVDASHFAPPAPSELEALRTRLDLQGCRVVLFVGSLSLPSHPLPILIKAFRIVLEKIPSARLVIVGGGEDFVTLQQSIKDQGLLSFVRFGGRVPASDVAAFYYLSDVSVEPVYNDDAARGRCPVKLFESWACGVPFVSADVGDRRMILGEPPAGLLATPGNPISFAEQISTLLADPELVTEINHRASQRLKKYSWNELALSLDQLYSHR